MGFGDLIYTLMVGGVRTLGPFVARGESKLARGIEGRREARSRLETWAREFRARERRLVWFHAPSVGEGLQARAVLESLVEQEPGIQSAFTFFSPSAESTAARMPVDVADYLPWDLPGEVGRVLDALRPRLLVFTKTEVWPILTREAARRDVPVALVAGTLSGGAGRLRAPARWYLRGAFRRLRIVGAISQEDGDRFHRGLGVPRERIVITGDPGVDSAWRRARGADPRAPYLMPLLEAPAPTVVAGSTWPPDEGVLLAACRQVRKRVPELRLVVAPHEPSPERIRWLSERLIQDGWATARLDAVEERGAVGNVNAVVVDRVGILAHLYTAGTVAYVGGGFHAQGLHSVLEPAAVGLPVTFGPGHLGSRAAGDLVGLGGARAAGDAQDLARILEGWLNDEAALEEAGARASGYIDRHRGAAARTAELLRELLAGG